MGTGKYTVREGDWLTRIARRFRTTIRNLIAMNRGVIRNPNVLYPGERINVPNEAKQIPHPAKAKGKKAAVVAIPTKPAPVPTLDRDKVINEANTQLGYREGWNGSDWDNIQKYSAELPRFKWTEGMAWCDVFFNWCFWVTGLLALLSPGVESASCAASMAAWKRAGRWSEYPALGAQIIFRNGEHTGIVIGYTATTVTTIEGNTRPSVGASGPVSEGYEVCEHTYQRSSAYITGYGYPKFPEGIVSADPAWKGRK